MRQINEAGMKLLETAEGFASQAYKDIAGYWTIGYGHKGAKPGTFISEPDAYTLLQHDLEIAEDAVTKGTMIVPLTDNQFSALVCFVYNVGVEAWRTSTLRKCLMRKEYLKAADEFTNWDHVHKDGHLVVSEGLKKRRAAERALFLTS